MYTKNNTHSEMSITLGFISPEPSILSWHSVNSSSRGFWKLKIISHSSPFITLSGAFKQQKIITSLEVY